MCFTAQTLPIDQFRMSLWKISITGPKGSEYRFPRLNSDQKAAVDVLVSPIRFWSIHAPTFHAAFLLDLDRNSIEAEFRGE
jgi:hypothetical protein